MTAAIAEECEHPSPVLAPSGLTIEERDVLAELMDSAVAPHLIHAVRERDAGAVEGLLAGLEWQDLAALAVVLAAAVEASHRGKVPQRRRTRRWDEYFELTREMGHTRRQAAERMGISGRTAQRYEARINARNEQDDD